MCEHLCATSPFVGTDPNKKFELKKLTFEQNRPCPDGADILNT